METGKINDFISIQPRKEGIKVSWSFSTFSRIEADGRVSCFIPSFDIHFSTTENNSDTIRRKGTIITKMFMDHFFIHSKSMKDFALEMHKRGFRAPNDAFVVKEFIKNNVSNTKFKFERNNQAGYTDKITQETEMEVAA